MNLYLRCNDSKKLQVNIVKIGIKIENILPVSVAIKEVNKDVRNVKENIMKTFLISLLLNENKPRKEKIQIKPHDFIISIIKLVGL